MKILFTLIKFRNLYRVLKSFLSEISTAATVHLYTQYIQKYTVRFFLTVAIGNSIVKIIPLVNFPSDKNIQTIFGTKLEDFLNYRTDYNLIS
jgi:hypothetical protein